MKCRGCSKWTDEKGRCPDCLISLCCLCDIRGTEYDFHKWSQLDYWSCRFQHHHDYSVSHDIDWSKIHGVNGSCTCSNILSAPEILKEIENKARITKEEQMAKECKEKEKNLIKEIKRNILATPIIYLAGKAIYSK